MVISLDDGRLRLRSGCSVWTSSERVLHPTPMEPGAVISTDIVIVGAGITGSFLAERFTREGRSVVVVDRHAATSASRDGISMQPRWRRVA